MAATREDKDDARAAESLPILSTHRISNPARFSALCGARDLLAVVHASWDISVYRIISGQVAFAIKRKDETEVQCLAWKADGTVLAVAWSDGAYALHEGERGGVIGTGRVEAGVAMLADDWRLDLRPDFGPDDDDENGPGPMINRFGWGEHHTQGLRKKTGVKRSGRDDFDNNDDDHDDDDDDESHDESDDESNADTLLPLGDLAASITLLDVTTVLPRLSAIPAHGMSIAKTGPAGNKFSTLHATDGVFEAKKDFSSGLVQNLLVCQEDGTVQVLLDETVRIGSCNVGARPIMQASHASSPYQAVLTQDEHSRLRLNLIHLPLPTLGGPLLHVIATNTKRMQNLLDYVLHTLRCIEHDFATGLQFPQRILNSLRGSLQEKEGDDVPANLYRLAMTGDFNAATLEWLTDVVKDTNLKRWDTAGTGMYAMLQAHLFTNLFPALDRLCIAASALRGQAAFHQGSTKFDCAPELFTDILSAVDCLRLVAEKALLIVRAESREFRAFSRWLKMMLEIALAEPLSKNAFEVEQREEPSIEYPLVLRYIKETMMHSRLGMLVETRSEMQQGLDQKDFFAHDVVRNLDFENTKRALKRGEQLRTSGNAASNAMDLALLSLPTIGAVLQGRVRVALRQITAWQSRMLSAPIQLPVDMGEPLRVLDMVLCLNSTRRRQSPANPDSNSAAKTKILAWQASSNAIKLLVVDLPSTPLPRSRSSKATPTSSFASRQQRQYPDGSTPPSLPSATPTTSNFFASPLGAHLLDAKFLPLSLKRSLASSRLHLGAGSAGDYRGDETFFLTLFRHDESEHAPRFASIILYSTSSTTSFSPSSRPSTFDSSPADAATSAAATGKDKLGESRTLHCFPSEKGFVPQSFIIGGRRGNMMCVVLGSRGREWMVLDLEGLLRGPRPAAADSELDGGSAGAGGGIGRVMRSAEAGRVGGGANAGAEVAE